MSSQQQAVRDEAVAWHVRLQSETAREEDWLAFETWLTRPANSSAYNRLETIMDAVVDERASIRRDMTRIPRSKTTPRGFPVWVRAAAVGLAAVVGIMVFAPQKPETYVFSAPANAVRSVTLADGTLVYLNRGTTVRVHTEGRLRQVTLERGEAAFTVTHDAARPFSVVAGDLWVRDIGTAFDVVRADRYVTVIVREGHVALTPVQGPEVNLGAGQQGRRDQGSAGVTVSVRNAGDAFAWQTGRLVYRDAPLAQVVEDLNRYSQVPVSIADARTAQLRFSGILVIGPAGDMVRRLEAFLPIQSAQDADRIVLRSSQ